VPSGKVKWFDAEKGFGFLANDEGGDVYVHASALPEGTPALRPGTRVEFGIAAGRKGDQALSVRILEAPPSLAEASRRDPEDMAAVVEDLIKVLERIGGSLRRGRYPAAAEATRVASVLRAVADDLDA
jgi:CspA family cold shock protein